IRRISNENDFTNDPPVLGYADIQSKLLYDVSPKNQFGVSLIFGDFNYEQNTDRAFLGLNTVFRGTSRNLLFNAHWAYTPNAKLFWQTRFFGLRSDFKNVNFDETTLLD